MFRTFMKFPAPSLYLMSSIITDPFRQKLLLSAVALGVVMDGIDGSIVNVALPTMATYFDTDTGTIAWVIITYLLMMAGLLLVFGKTRGPGSCKKTVPSGICDLHARFCCLRDRPHRLTSCSLHGSCRESGLR